MTLIKLNDSEETTILIDMYIRKSADDEDDDNFFGVADYLRNQLYKKGNIPHLDAFLLTHNDDDHIKGLENHFYLGDPSDYEEPEEDEEPLIIINEIWGSSRFWKRASDSNKLGDEGKAYNREMKRRIKLFEENDYTIQDSGDKVIIIGEDPDGKTEKLGKIVKDVGTIFSKINGTNISEKIKINILGPLSRQEDESEKDFKEKNRSSVILQILVKEGEYTNHLLLGGDAEVFVWECLGKKYKENKKNLVYDVMLTPHHCSWHSLSNDSQSKSEDPKINKDAKFSLEQAKDGAFIISSSKPIKNDDDDPPSFAAKQEYLSMIDEKHFLCTEEYPNEKESEPIVIKLTEKGPQLKSLKSKPKLTKAAIASTGEAFPHGQG